MAETKNHEEPALPSKRKPDATLDEPIDDYPTKKNPKLQSSGSENQDPAKDVELEPAASEDEQDDDQDYGSEDEDNEEEDGEKSNGEAEADRKGKGIMRDDKGKGKLIEEEEDDDDSDDDSSDGGSELEEDGDSDLSDDPLAEVDLDNILPSRTRRRQIQPGVYIANDLGNADDDDDDDSDDSDA